MEITWGSEQHIMGRATITMFYFNGKKFRLISERGYYMIKVAILIEDRIIQIWEGE